MKIGRKKCNFWLVLFLMVVLIVVTQQPINAQAVEQEETIEVIDLSKYILQTGGLSGPSEDNIYKNEQEIEVCGLLSTGTELAEELIYEGLKNKSESIDLTSCSLATADFSTVYHKVLNFNPELFYVLGSASYYSSGSYVTKVVPSYDSSTSTTK